MTKPTKPPARPKLPARPLVIRTAGSEEEAGAQYAAAVESQKKWAHAVADGIERGELPIDAQERRVIAGTLRRWADQLQATEHPKGPGNPKWKGKAKIYDPDSVALQVGYRIAFGDDAPGAIAHVADMFGVDDSTIAKIFRQRRDAVADWFVNSNLRHRVGAIRGE